MMKWIMTIAAGVALGYFLVQYITKNARVRENEENDTTDAETIRAEENKAETTPANRLHKSRTNKQIAGVCGGIAEYLRVDPSIVRLVTIVLMLGWGSGLLAYIICAIIIPEE